MLFFFVFIAIPRRSSIIIHRYCILAFIFLVVRLADADSPFCCNLSICFFLLELDFLIIRFIIRIVVALVIFILRSLLSCKFTSELLFL
jgi:hypothetical protein